MSSNMEAFSGSEKLQYQPFVPVEGQHNSETVEPSPSVVNENKEDDSQGLTLSVYEPNVLEADIVNLRSDELVEVPVAVAELHHTHSLDGSIQDKQSNNKGICPSRTWEDGYNWRKYGQKHIKGNEFPRSYYKCSHPNCQVKKQVEQSHDGRITDVIYRGKHDHSKSKSFNNIAEGTNSSVQGERCTGVSVSENTEDKLLKGNDPTAHPAKQNGGPQHSEQNGTLEFSTVVTSDNNADNMQLSRTRDKFEDDDDDPESKRRCLDIHTEITSDSEANQRQIKGSLEAHQGMSQAFTSPSSNEKLTAIVASHEMTPSVTPPTRPIEMVNISKALVPVGVDFDDTQQSQGIGTDVQALQIDRKGNYPSATADRFWGDGYNWRKYGQKHIKGSEFPRSYYRCTYPNCQVKKQLECSHEGQITDIVYKGEHNHPKPQPSSHIAVGRILSIQAEGLERFSYLNHTLDKSLTDQTTLSAELNGTQGLYPMQRSDTNVQGDSEPNRSDEKVEQNVNLDSRCGHLMVGKEISKDATTGLKNQQCKPSVEVQDQCQSQSLVSSPSARYKETSVSSHELTPTTVSNSPVYVVTARGIVPVEVNTEDKRQRKSSGTVGEKEDSNQNGLSLSMTERLLENAYHWRKYGQKNIKGSEFPRSYYRCTHPNCQVKMQLERSHDGKIIEIIYKGKHDHPKPQPITRMAIGAILSLEDDRSDILSDGSGDIYSNGHAQASVYVNTNRISVLSPVAQSAENVETVGQKLSSVNETEDDNDIESKRKRDIGDVDHAPVIRTPREPRVIVETLSEVDVVDDGYRWQKYGRKTVKGNSNPRNYYRCSNGGCSVKKHVERAAKNPKAVITTYEGKHNHDFPLGRISTHDTAAAAAAAGLVVLNTDRSNDTLGTYSNDTCAVSSLSQESIRR